MCHTKQTDRGRHKGGMNSNSASQGKTASRPGKHVNSLDQDHDSEDELFVGELNSETTKQNRVEDKSDWKVCLKVNGQPVKLKIDTGAEANVISYQLYRNLRRNKARLKPTNTKLTTYSGEPLPVKGMCVFPCSYNGNEHSVKFLVVNLPSVQPVLGVNTCMEMSLVQRVYMVHKTARKVPAMLHKKLKTEVDRMEQLNVISKVNKPTSWVNSVVVVETSDGKIRLCLDPKDLNRAVKRSHYQLPTTEEISTRLTGAQYLSCLDASSGFWQCCLYEESSELYTFNTRFGRYKYLRMPFGISSAPEVFHRVVKEIFEGIDRVESYMDDFLVLGRTKDEHDTRLRNVLQRARENNFKLNGKKCKFAQTEIKYLGHILSRDGLKPDDSKVEAVLGMPTPQCKKDVERF
ncbi:hypothetical protein BSL78_24481 [Apostichopus japonicus]|uniref:Reverse transcriptase domain-containing protein n=1 Tax=Stichopus japonicus TaxID=307972 RepID=A0A2G8JSL7_STIJA|nr:hypothetical protein BSL78_24481 [Apostichopus japonicus]